MAISREDLEKHGFTFTTDRTLDRMEMLGKWVGAWRKEVVVDPVGPTTYTIVVEQWDYTERTGQAEVFVPKAMFNDADFALRLQPRKSDTVQTVIDFFALARTSLGGWRNQLKNAA